MSFIIQSILYAQKIKRFTLKTIVMSFVRNQLSVEDPQEIPQRRG